MSMLINCPKCGFSQPQDRYCANCGVDMETYRPKAESFWKKIASNPFLHVALVFLLVFASILFIQKNRREELRTRVAFLKSGPVIVEHEEKPPVEIVAKPKSETMAAASQLPPPAPTPVTPTTLAKAVSADKNLQVTKATFYFLEVDSALMASWLQDSRTNGQYHRTFDNVSMGPIPNVTQKLKAQRVRVLQKIERPIDATNPIADFISGTHHGADPDSELGLAGSVAISEIKDGLIRGEVEVRRSFKDPKDVSKPVEQTSFGFAYELSPTDGYMMTGILPRRVYDFPDDWNPDPFLTIYKSRPFLSGQSEFALIVQFDTH